MVRDHKEDTQLGTPRPLVPLDVDDPIDILAQENVRQKWLCDVLETIADGLPDKFECALAGMAAEALRAEVPLHYRQEEEGLFPLIAQRAAPEDNIEAVIRQLKKEHLADDTYAIDLIEMLGAIADGIAPNNPEMAGYMIRGFFETYRRHIAFEDLVVLRLARLRLTHEDLGKLLSFIQESRREITTPYH